MLNNKINILCKEDNMFNRNIEMNIEKYIC